MTKSNRNIKHNPVPSTEHPVPSTQHPASSTQHPALSSPPSAQTDVLVKVENLGKKFCRDLKTSLWYGVKDLSSEFFGRQRSEELRPKEFWAVNDVSFELRRGECLGLIGHNGAGKSTLLKMLNGLIKPDKGTITMKGRIGALIELGAGFNPVLTGRENIYINGQVLGFTNKEINDKFDAIIDFAEIGDFIDTPVQNYSSGMKVRLGFAVASQMEPDVLLIDEVLAVGDVAFKLKCFSVIDKILDKCAIVFVSHSMQQISRLCNHILMMENGGENYKGTDVSKGIDAYYINSSSNIANFVRDESEVKVVEISINDSIEDRPIIPRLGDLDIRIKLDVLERIIGASISITLLDFEQKPIGICYNETPINETNIIERNSERAIVNLNLNLKRINLSKGIYLITLNLSERINYKPIAKLQNVKSFQVTSKRDVWPPLELEGSWR